MSYLETKHKKKSAAITSIILMLIVVGILNFGMQYLDPPEEYGLAINLGDSNVGNGDPIENTKENSIVKEKVEKVEEIIQEVIPKETIKEKVITQETKDATIIEDPKEKKVVKPVEKKEIVDKPKEIPKPKPTKATQDALNSLLNGNTDTGKPKGEGDDVNTGVKGDKNGDPKSNNFYENKGSGGDKNYDLDGRSVILTPEPTPDCNEDGYVFVRIEVDNTGKVIKAEPGIKGTTNSAKCLKDSARDAALKTTWSPDLKGSNKQIGTIIYYFTLK